MLPPLPGRRRRDCPQPHMQRPGAPEEFSGGGSGLLGSSAHARLCLIARGQGKHRKGSFPPPASLSCLCQDLFWLWGFPPWSPRGYNLELTTELSQKQ